ncbi:ribbon-helix-helix protein, CopG family [Rhodococcus sp. NPDC003318]|uniref:ribbon-helix-helix protein, CopG family n=1 Tax=Rhodococcus sp. NPDC003318 TaxID=3364503 RepID=UPI0036CEF5C1
MSSIDQRKATNSETARSGDAPSATKSIRLSVNMNPETADALKEIAESNGISVTEAVRRAISVAHFIEAQTRAGKSVQIEDPKTGKVRELIMM